MRKCCDMFEGMPCTCESVGHTFCDKVTNLSSILRCGGLKYLFGASGSRKQNRFLGGKKRMKNIFAKKPKKVVHFQKNILSLRKILKISKLWQKKNKLLLRI